MERTANTCSLDRGARERRLDEIAALASRSLLELDPTPHGVRLRLRTGDGIQADLVRLIAAESECCPFLDFELRAADREIVLDVTGPADARPLIDRLLDLRGAPTNRGPDD